ncbi:MAG TPA: hypothetical protein VLM85_15230 [Polyangiaceae bacterium]|nr:hypothetical protein [Polyangiaceae bacterium]
MQTWGGIAIVLCVSVLACGGAIQSSPDDGGAAKDASDADTTPVVDASPLGSLVFQRDNSASGAPQFYGLFFSNAQQASGCAPTTTIGACSAYTCGSTPPAGPYLGAGTLTLTTPQGSFAVTQSTQSQLGDYSFALPAPFTAGDVLGVSASGGDVPAFAPVVVTAPGPITLSAPQPGTISTQQDLSWTWTLGEPNAKVSVEVMAFVPNATQSVSCAFDATSGAGTMPASLLAPLKGSNGMLFWAQQRSTSYVAGTYPLQVTAVQMSSGSATFQ